MKGLSLGLAVTFLSVSVFRISGAYDPSSLEDFCGWAPLCGSSPAGFGFYPPEDSSGNDHPTIPWEYIPMGQAVVSITELEMKTCCSLKDTHQTEDCQAINPNGAAERWASSLTPPCNKVDSETEEVEDICPGDCGNYELILLPEFVSSTSNGAATQCCDSCACYGDPMCRAFSGETKAWVLCDGREPPNVTAGDTYKRCRITQNQCTSQLDHAGNKCQYQSWNSQGKGWSTVERGSPCVPNSKSPASIITMYEFDADTVNDVGGFSLQVEQGERGTIMEVFLTLSYGRFTLDSLSCLTKGADAWANDDNLAVPIFFEYNEVVPGKNVAWNIIDPDTKIAISLRCFSNTYTAPTSQPTTAPFDASTLPKVYEQPPFEAEDGIYVPRINVESISDPLSDTRNVDAVGFCVSGEFDYGMSTYEYGAQLEMSGICDAGLENAAELDIVREICQNPAMPASNVENCLHNFCSDNYYPLYDNADQCYELISATKSRGFCRAIVYLETDIQECVDQWSNLGAIATIQQYLASNAAGCSNYNISNFPASAENCQGGVTLQYAGSKDWVDFMFLPDDLCGDTAIILNKCDYPQLFVNEIRFVQRTVDVSCGPAYQCKRIDGFYTTIGLMGPPTTAPTSFPSNTPTESPTHYPTKSPTKFPTPPTFSPTRSPTDYPSLSPTFSPTKFPTNKPQTENPTSFPTGFPTTSDIVTPAPVATRTPTTPYPTNFPTYSPTRSPFSDFVPPIPTCDYRLCDTPENYIPLDADGYDYSTRFESCCRSSFEDQCADVDEKEIFRATGTENSFCGDFASDLTSEAPARARCYKGDTLTVDMVFGKDEDTVCCKTCKCFGDPICISFSDVVDDFVLCDGRTPQYDKSDPFEERCIIRRDTCLEQKDHEGHQCQWWNPKNDPPVYDDPDKQAKAEIQWSVPKYGSPCQYSPKLSGPSYIDLYEVPDFKVYFEQYDRGYLSQVFLITRAGNYTLNATRCLAGDGWTINSVVDTEAPDTFTYSKYKQEYFWKVVGAETGIELGVRCTGTRYNGALTQKFLNIEFLHEPDFNRASEGSGFCVSNDIEEKALATYETTDYLKDNGYCYDWNLERTDIMLRNSFRMILDNPGLSTYGTRSGINDFCKSNASPRYSSVKKCYRAFTNAKNIEQLIGAFCKAVTFDEDTAVCEEALERYAEEDGYETAFEQGREQYILEYNTTCDLNELESTKSGRSFLQSGYETCRLPVSLQYMFRVDSVETDTGVFKDVPRWKTVKEFPAEISKCRGYTMRFKYGDDVDTDKLFQYPIRLYQEYIPQDGCGYCDYISTVVAGLKFLPIGV